MRPWRWFTRANDREFDFAVSFTSLSSCAQRGLRFGGVIGLAGGPPPARIAFSSISNRPHIRSAAISFIALPYAPIEQFQAFAPLCPVVRSALTLPIRESGVSKT